MKKLTYISAVLILVFGQLQAQREGVLDSLEVVQEQERIARKLMIKKAIKTPVILIGAGVLALTDNDLISSEDVYEIREKHIPNFRTHVDDYIQYAPIVAVYGLNMAGVKGKHDFRTRSALLLKSELLVGCVVTPIKKITNQLRPDGSTYNTFPSGHTAQAFVAATFLHKEYGHLSRWYSISGYAVASAVGLLRISNNRHWASDVLAGAGLGILSTQVVYMLHKEKQTKKNKKKIMSVPYYNPDSAGIIVKIDL